VKTRVRMMKGSGRIRRRKEKIGRGMCRGWKEGNKCWKRNRSYPFYDDVWNSYGLSEENKFIRVQKAGDRTN
jgi:hypothetical protein